MANGTGGKAATIACGGQRREQAQYRILANRIKAEMTQGKFPNLKAACRHHKIAIETYKVYSD